MKIIKGNFKNPENDETRDENDLYSKMMYNLIKPHISNTPAHIELEDMLTKGMIAWNMANLKATGLPLFDGMYNEILKNGSINKKGKAIIDKMIAEKVKQYAEYQNFIEDFEIYEDESGVALIKIISKKPEDILMEENDDDDDDWDMDMDMDMNEYEEGFINREAIVVTPKDFFYKWLEKHGQELPSKVLSDKPIIYLFEEQTSEKKTVSWIKKNFDKIFINELINLRIQPEDLPERRTYKMFTDFFEIKHHDMVFDLEEEPVVKN